MKLISAFQDWYSAYRDEKLRKFENRCLDDIASRLSEQDRLVLARQREKIMGVFRSPFPSSKQLKLFGSDLDEFFVDESGRKRNGLLARMEYGFPDAASVTVEFGVSLGVLDGFITGRRMTWRERCDADCELISIQVYPPAPSLPPDIDIVMAHRAEVEAASDGLVTILDPASRDLRSWENGWFLCLGEMRNQYYLIQEMSHGGMVLLHDYSAHDHPAGCPCVIPLLKWAAAHLDYLDQPEIDKITRAVALLPDPSGATVTTLSES
jgi:hypothetical protein